MMTKIQNFLQPKRKYFTWLWRSLIRSFATYTSLLWEIFCVDIKRQIWIQRGKNGCKILSSLGIPQVWIIPLPTGVCLRHTDRKQPVRASQTNTTNITGLPFVCFSDDPQIDSNNNPFQRAINMRFWTRISISLVSTWVGLVTRSTNKTATDKS